MTEHIDGYDELTVKEAKAAIRSGEFDNDQLADIKAYEEENKHRVTLLRWLDDRHEETDPGRPETVTVECGDRIGYVAGLHFEYPFEHKTVEYSLRIERAIEAGDLRRVE